MTSGNESEVIEKLNVLIRLTAIGLLVDKSQKEQVEILGKAGLKPKDIADLLGTTPNTVSVALSNLRKEKKVPRSR